MIGSLHDMQGWEQVAREAEYNAAKMAGLCAISERKLQRIFKRHLRCTPSRWLRNLQCRIARDLIQSGYSSKAAAAELKFSTEAHFCREFKKVYGCPPQTFAPDLGNSIKPIDLERALEMAAKKQKKTAHSARGNGKLRPLSKSLASRA